MKCLECQSEMVIIDMDDSRGIEVYTCLACKSDMIAIVDERFKDVLWTER